MAPSGPQSYRLRMERRITGVMETPDGYWRVEQHEAGRAVWWRVFHAKTWLHDAATPELVEQMLGEDFPLLRPVDADPDAA